SFWWCGNLHVGPIRVSRDPGADGDENADDEQRGEVPFHAIVTEPVPNDAGRSSAEEKPSHKRCTISVLIASRPYTACRQAPTSRDAYSDLVGDRCCAARSRQSPSVLESRIGTWCTCA